MKKALISLFFLVVSQTIMAQNCGIFVNGVMQSIGPVETIVGDATDGLSLDTNHNGIPDITFPASGGATIGGSAERITFPTNGQYFDANDSSDTEAMRHGYSQTELKTTVPLNSEVESGWLKLRVYKDDTFADDERMPLTMGDEADVLDNGDLDGTYVSEGTNIVIAPDWIGYGLDAGTDTAEQEESTVHSAGGQAQKITADAVNEGFRQSCTQVKITDSGYYRLTAWAYVSVGVVTVKAQEGANDWTEYGAVNSATTGAWELLMFEFQKAADGAATNIIFLSSGGAATYIIDDVVVTEITPSSGFGRASCGDEHFMFSWETDGSVQMTGGTTNTAASDSDTDFCIYDGGCTPWFRNRLGASKEFRCEAKYN